MRRDKRGYLNIPCAFDIETTAIYCPKRKTCELAHQAMCTMQDCEHWIDPYAFMYCWQAAIGTETVILGNTFEDLKYFFKRVSEYTDSNKRLVFYVHNLSYEFTFLQSHFNITEMFARKPRQPLKFCIGNLEFRCSYMLSNMSLAKWCQNTPNVTHGKLVGALDYDKLRTPSTPQTEDEIAYRINDVLGITECLTEYLKSDTIASIPLTSTGLIRRDIYRRICKNSKERRRFENNALNPDQYVLCKETFRGGNTHANHHYTGDILQNVGSIDIASSYPYVMMVEPFPERFIRESVANIGDYRYPDYSYIGVFRYRNIRFKAKHNIPYIPASKCQSIAQDSVRDNGRILSSDEIIIALTNIDREIIHKQYRFDSEDCSVLYVARNEYQPTEIRQEIMELFTVKCRLKDIEDMEYEYLKSKNKLNGCYGMEVTDITQDDIVFADGKWSTVETDKARALKRYYKNPKSFMTYQHGLFVPAYARRNLDRMLDVIGSDVIYCDTDSVKYLGEHKAEIDAINKDIIANIHKAPIPPHVRVDGKDYYMGVWEDEGRYSKFVTLGAKKYAYQKKGKIKTTVAGLGKDAGAAYFKDHPIEDFKPGLVFYPSGRLNAFYNDVETHEITLNGETFTTGSNVALVPGTYVLGITDEYADLLDNKYYI